MTGSGPTVFGLFADEDALLAAREALERRGLCSFLTASRMVI